MLHLKSKPKEIEYYIQQVEMLAMSEDESIKIAKIMALKELISDLSIKELIAEDLKDERWIEETNILINTCNKRQVKSTILQEHIQECKNFIVFRYMEDKLLYVKEILLTKSPWIFEEIDASGNKSTWINSKFVKIFEDSDVSKFLFKEMPEENLIIDHDWLHINKELFFTQDLFEDIDFLIQKKKKVLEV